MLGMAPVAVAIARVLPSTLGPRELEANFHLMYAADKIVRNGETLKDKHHPITATRAEEVSWATGNTFQIGDVIHVDFHGSPWSGTYCMTRKGVFERIS
jgi:hypothetical protein